MSVIKNELQVLVRELEKTRLQQISKGIQTTPRRIINNCKCSTQNLPLSQMEGITEITPMHHYVYSTTFTTIKSSSPLFQPHEPPHPFKFLRTGGIHKTNRMPVLYAIATPFLTYREYKHADPASTLTPLGMTVCLDDPLTDPMKRGVLRKDTGDSSTIDRASKRLSTRVLLFIPNDVNRAWHPH